MEKIISLSVHTLVDFLFRKGDIDERIFNTSTMAEGVRLHAYYQAKQKKNYLSEYYLEESFKVGEYTFKIDGRADGVILNENSATIDEIKSTVVDLDEFFSSEGEWHLAQAKVYGLMVAHKHGYENINIQLSYIHQITKSEKYRFFSFTKEELEKDIVDMFNEYLSFYEMIEKHIESRNKSAEKLSFPFKSFRKGQRSLAKYAYAIARDGGLLFVEAPTGIGKTMSTLFPFTKSFKDNENDKIFYLTAKGSGKEIALNSMNILKENGLDAYPLIITSKDKICPHPDKGCNPDECPLAKGYYSTLKNALVDALRSEDTFSKATIERIATHYAICPFEFSLDLSLYADVIICDYNYFFDPTVYLRRFFDENRFRCLLLVDEAHNLVERGRNMYSASFDEYSFSLAKKAVKHLEHKKIKNAIKRISKIFNDFDEYPLGDTLISEGLSDKTLRGIEAYLLASTDVSRYHHAYATEEFMDFFFALNKFSKIYDFYDDNFALYVHKSEKNTSINLFCLDPSDLLRNSLNKIKGKIMLSATLSPTEYYIDMIGGANFDPLLSLPSPFKKDNLLVMIAPNISIRYKNRESTIFTVVEYIINLVSLKVGNYFIYVPSYEYLNQIRNYLSSDEFDLFVQEKDMDENSKEQFLSLFKENPERTTIGLLVIGGTFSEGVDLVSDRLIGVIIVGVGLPQICFERDLIKDYYQNKNQHGFDYAYTDPGMNKVMQAVGRVIRSETDKGVALLIDDRYLSSNYRSLFDKNWPHYEVVTSVEDIKELTTSFWKR